MADLPLNLFKRAIYSGQTQYGAWLMLASPIASEALAYAGFDFLVLDMEHAPADIPNALSQLQAIEGGGTQVVVRLAWNDQVLIKRALDIGAQTIMLPFVQTKDEAEAAVRAARYPLAGRRGVAASHRASRYGLVKDYLKRADAEIVVIVQIETPEALDRLPEIAAVDGVDAVFIGPADLSASMGHLGNIGHPDVMAALARGVAACKAAGKPVGIIGPTEELSRTFAEMGFAYVALGSDIGFLISAATARLAKFKQAEAVKSGY